MKLRADLFDEKFRKIWKDRDKLPMRNIMRGFGVSYEELRVHSVGDCVIFYECEVTGEVPEFLTILKD